MNLLIGLKQFIIKKKLVLGLMLLLVISIITNVYLLSSNHELNRLLNLKLKDNLLSSSHIISQAIIYLEDAENADSIASKDELLDNARDILVQFKPYEAGSGISVSNDAFSFFYERIPVAFRSGLETERDEESISKWKEICSIIELNLNLIIDNSFEYQDGRRVRDKALNKENFEILMTYIINDIKEKDLWEFFNRHVVIF